MFDAKQLLNELLGAQGAQTAGDVANRAGAAVSGAWSQAQSQLQGTEAGAALDQAKQFASQNKLATGAALGGLAALLFGTRSGRSIAGGAVGAGALAGLGGLAYKAFTNYQQGKPLTAGVPGLDGLTAAPADSAFHQDAHTSETAILLIRAMIATAAADGVVDDAERTRIVGQMHAAGMDADAARFLDEEIKHPAGISDLAAGAGGSPELGAQIYAAAVLSAGDTSPAETAFLAKLASALNLDPGLVANLRAAAAPAT
jgi:uncharacterized membrane protein YebE (DUF533 family)